MDKIESIKTKCFSVYAYLKFMGEYASDQLSDAINCDQDKVDFLHSTTKKFIETVQKKLTTYAKEMAELSMLTVPKSNISDFSNNSNSSLSTILADIEDLKKDCTNLSLKRYRSVEEYTDDSLLEHNTDVNKIENKNENQQVINISSNESNSSKNDSVDSDETCCPDLKDIDDNDTIFTELLHGLGENENEHVPSLLNVNDEINEDELLSSSSISEFYSNIKSQSSTKSSSSSSYDSEAENYKYTDEDYCEINGIKPCYICLTDFLCHVQKKKTVISSNDKEMCEINRLTNMSTLENPTITTSNNNNHDRRSKKRKRLQMETDNDLDASTVPIEENETMTNSLKGPEVWSNCSSDTEHDDISCGQELLAHLGESNVEESSDDHSEIFKLKRKKQKVKHRKISTSSSSEEIDKDADKKLWQKDPLLTFRLSSDCIDSEEDESNGNNSSKSAYKEEKIEGNGKSTEEGLLDKEVIPVEFVTLDSDKESDCEYIGKTFKTEVCDKGRRNIRAIKSIEELEENTQLAQRNEKEHMQRVNEQTKKIQAYNTLNTSNEDLILDVDDQYKPLIVVDSILTRKLKKHQKEGVRFMWTSCFENVDRIKTSNGTGCILAHCMGLGKTLQAIALIHTLFKYKGLTGTKHVLIVCPLSTAQNWKDEFKEMLTGAGNVDFTVSLLNKKFSREQKVNVIANWYATGGVLILGYESLVYLVKDVLQTTTDVKLRTEYKALLNPGPDLIICDEGHSIRNNSNSRSKCLMAVKTRRRIVLTGTPFQNNLEELYYMVQFVKPNFLGTKAEFMNRFANPILNGGYFDSTEDDIKIMQKRSHVLHKYLNATVQRYESSELMKYLPEKHDFTLLISSNPIQVELYNKYLSLVKSTTKTSFNRFLNDYIMLRNIWSHPRLLKEREAIKMKEACKETDDDVIITSDVQGVPNDWYHRLYPNNIDCLEFGPKLAVIMSIIDECEAIGEKVVIFASSLLNLDCIEYYLKTSGTSHCKFWLPNIDYIRMDGSVSLDVRHECCKRFASESKVRVLLLSQKVGGIGLNFVAANRLILMDVHFNPAVDNQSVYRILRFGQTRKCYIYRLVSKGTMEETVYDRSVTKASISARVVDVKQIKRLFKRQDLEIMYRCSEIPNTRPVMNEPNDKVLAKVLKKHNEIFEYHDYHSLLENQLHEQLNETEQQEAWAEFEKEREDARIQALQKSHMAKIQQTLNPQQTGHNGAIDGTSMSSNPVLVLNGLNAINATSNADEGPCAEKVRNNHSNQVTRTTSNIANNRDTKNGSHTDGSVLLINDDLIQSENVNKPNVDSSSSLRYTFQYPPKKITSAVKRMSVPTYEEKTDLVLITDDGTNKSSLNTSFHIRERVNDMVKNHCRQSTPLGLTNKNDETQQGRKNDVIEID